MTFELKKLASYFRHHRAPLVKVGRNTYMVGDFERLGQQLTSGQGHMRSHIDPSRPCCISVNASSQDKHNETTLMSQAHFNRELLAKPVYDLG